MAHPLVTPHCGFHWNQRQLPFFEGWYYRLTLPPAPVSGSIGASHALAGETLAFMYSFHAPGASAVQVLGPGEAYLHHSFDRDEGFWAWPDALGHGHRPPLRQPNGPHYRVTPTHHSGRVHDPIRQRSLRWAFEIAPVYGWGSSERRQRSTAGWLSRFPIFEPGWQVLMAHGLASGWVEWHDGPAAAETWEDRSVAAVPIRFEAVPAYAEKNWGGAFPDRWFWIQCNAFRQQPDLALTSAGGIRRMLGRRESVGMVGLHHAGRFHEFAPWNSRMGWQIQPWGQWRVWAERRGLRIVLEGCTQEPGVQVQVPTAAGLAFGCRDTTRGQLSLRLWDTSGGERRLLLDAVSEQAGLEVGERTGKRPGIRACHRPSEWPQARTGALRAAAVPAPPRSRRAAPGCSAGQGSKPPRGSSGRRRQAQIQLEPPFPSAVAQQERQAEQEQGEPASSRACSEPAHKGGWEASRAGRQPRRRAARTDGPMGMGYNLRTVLENCRLLARAGFREHVSVNYSFNVIDERPETIRQTVAYHRELERIFGADKVEPAIFFIGLQPHTLLEHYGFEQGLIEPGYNPMSMMPWTARKLLWNPEPMGSVCGRICLEAFETNPGDFGRTVMALATAVR